jgi:two-component system chemotaxis response regulator CheB
VLVVDDSSFMRKNISFIIEKDPQLFVVGIARDGIEAIEKVQSLKPDIVTMDVEMARMDGITALSEIMKICPVPVVMLSNYTEGNADITIRALQQGAVDFFLKSELIGQNVEIRNVEDFLCRLKSIVENSKFSKVEVEKSEDREMILLENNSLEKNS